jgi:hypothetical protein
MTTIAAAILALWCFLSAVMAIAAAKLSGAPCHACLDRIPKCEAVLTRDVDDYWHKGMVFDISGGSQDPGMLNATGNLENQASSGRSSPFPSCRRSGRINNDCRAGATPRDGAPKKRGDRSIRDRNSNHRKAIYGFPAPSRHLLTMPARSSSAAFGCGRRLRIMSRIVAAFEHFRRAALRSAPSSSRCQRDMSLRISLTLHFRSLRCRHNGLSRCLRKDPPQCRSEA